jgi:hypothetical protein
MQIGVIGSWEENLDKEIYDVAGEVGRLVAIRGGTILTGGSTGVMPRSTPQLVVVSLRHGGNCPFRCRWPPMPPPRKVLP